MEQVASRYAGIGLYNAKYIHIQQANRIAPWGIHLLIKFI
jgi:hypothetical protein